MKLELSETCELEYVESNRSDRDDMVYVMVENVAYDAYYVRINADMASVVIYKDKTDVAWTTMAMCRMPMTAMRLLVLADIADMELVN